MSLVFYIHCGNISANAFYFFYKRITFNHGPYFEVTSYRLFYLRTNKTIIYVFLLLCATNHARWSCTVVHKRIVRLWSLEFSNLQLFRLYFNQIGTHTNLFIKLNINQLLTIEWHLLLCFCWICRWNVRFCAQMSRYNTLNTFCD